MRVRDGSARTRAARKLTLRFGGRLHGRLRLDQLQGCFAGRGRGFVLAAGMGEAGVISVM